MWFQRRKSTRYPCRLPIRYGPPGDEQGLQAETIDVSRHGLYVATAQVAEVGAILWFEIDLTFQVFKLQGLVAWSRPAGTHENQPSKPGFGVELVDVPVEWLDFFPVPLMYRAG